MKEIKNCVLFVLFGMYLAISGCQIEAQPEITFADDIAIEWKLISNDVDNGNRYRAAFTFENYGDEPLQNSDWTLYFNYRHNIQEETTSDNAEINFINGDFFRLSPTTDFELPPGEKTTIEYEGRGSVIKDDRSPRGLYFVFGNGQDSEPETIVVSNYTFQRIEPGQVPQERGLVKNAEARFQENQQTELLKVSELAQVLPTPHFIQYSGDTLSVNRETRIHYGEEVENEAWFLADALEKRLDAGLEISENSETGPGIISLLVDESVSEDQGGEGYQLEISEENGIRISGAGPAGVFYGMQTLLHLFPADLHQTPQTMVELPALNASDSPRYPYRGMHLDVSRNFNEKEEVFKLLDLMAFYKLNKFHFHLTDDEGWRLQNAELPELTEIGAFRGHTLTDEEHLQPAYGSGPFPDPEASYGSGYYTREDYRDIIRYAHERHIEVIPEFDVPGHARAAIKSMEVRYHRLLEEDREEEADEYLLNDLEDESVYSSAQNFNDNVISVCKESAYRFFETVVDDVLEIHREADVPLNVIHMGGDEVPQGSWEKSPLCAQFIEENEAIDSVADLPGYFVDRLTEMLAERDLTLAGWQEIAMRGGGHGESEIDTSFAENEVMIYSWDNFTSNNRDLGYKVANAGYPVVLCNATNLYFELAYNWDPAEPGDYFGGSVDTRKAFEFMPMNFTDPLHENDGGSEGDYTSLTPASEFNIKGMQGHLWSEPIKGRDSLEYFYAPKLLALAERAWADQPSWETMDRGEQRSGTFLEDWNRFANRVGQIEMPKMDYLFGGFNYRLPLPGAIIDEYGRLQANAEYPGLTIRYTTDGTRPTGESNTYQSPVEVEGQVKLRTFDTRGRGSRVVIISR